MKLNRFASTVAALVGAASIAAAADPAATATFVPTNLFKLSDPDLEITVWATTPQLKNPTDMDTDQCGRIWVAEGVDYRAPSQSAETNPVVRPRLSD